MVVLGAALTTVGLGAGLEVRAGRGPPTAAIREGYRGNRVYPPMEVLPTLPLTLRVRRCGMVEGGVFTLADKPYQPPRRNDGGGGRRWAWRGGTPAPQGLAV